MSTSDASPATKFRPPSRRRNRIAAGVALGAFAIGANVLVYSAADGGEPVVQVVRDVPAGEQITADMLRTVDVDADDSVNVVKGADISRVVGPYAKVRLVSGSLVVGDALQTDPLVTAGHAVVAIQVGDGELPIGLRERVPVRLVIPADRNVADDVPAAVEGRIVGLPRPADNAIGSVSVSVELQSDAATLVAAADDVRIILLVPADDPAALATSRPEDGG